MKKFFVEGTQLACLDDRLANARVCMHTDLRSLEAKIYRTANMSLVDYFQNPEAFRELQRLLADAGVDITPKTSYMETANIIKCYVENYDMDWSCSVLISAFLYPIRAFISQFRWAQEYSGEDTPPKSNTAESNTKPKKKQHVTTGVIAYLKKNHMEGFYVWMEEYASVLECMFPEDKYKQVYYEEMFPDPLFEGKEPIIMEFVFKLLYDDKVLNNKWPLLRKFLVDPYARIYVEKIKIDNELIDEELLTEEDKKNEQSDYIRKISKGSGGTQRTRW